MATQTEVRLVDDIDGGPAVETIEFSLDGRSLEIDLSETHAAELRAVLERHVAAARKVSTTKRDARSTVPATVRTSGRSHNQAIREWAQAQGMPVGDRGRIAADIVAAYLARPAGPAVPAETRPETPPEAPVEAAEPTDQEVMAWWQARGYKPATKVTGLMRSKHRAAQR